MRPFTVGVVLTMMVFLSLAVVWVVFLGLVALTRWVF